VRQRATAAIDPANGQAAAAEFGGFQANIGPRAFAADRDRRRVLSDQQCDLAIGSARRFVHQPMLQCQARFEVDHAQQMRGHGRRVPLAAVGLWRHGS